MEKIDKTKLNIGSNDFRYPGFLNVDVRDVPGVDIVDDVRFLTKIEDGSCEHIIAEAVLEHFSPDRTENLIKLWASKLKPGGILEIMVPDGEMLMDKYYEDKKKFGQRKAWDEWSHDSWGNLGYLRQWHGEDAETYGHHTLFCRAQLEEQMANAGLIDITQKTARHGACMTSVGIKS